MEPPRLVDPEQPLLDGYVIRLPFPMARRVEDGSLVFWHTPKGLTFWISAGERDHATDPLEDWKSSRSTAAQDECVERAGALLRYGYRLEEESDDGRQSAFYGFVAEGRAEFSIAAYFDSPETIEDVLETWRSIRAAN
ncbi:hypothetical protein [Bradyrhizobium sp. LHD-71]|uniref:hypothetical protein n=1 Tax=Bradyrhizobium sp. LHD-71 TaxID=3072141 RepID=UPI0028100336|nr:hypothetical protein [Bradyrhizobium sp. LHD-71]MDQ8730007.1 hypothetical protein [Bradyrhizobium sp. LHD-71]